MEIIPNIIVIAIIAVVAVVGMFLAFRYGYSYRKKFAELKIGSAEDEAKRILDSATSDAKKTADNVKKEKLYAELDKLPTREKEVIYMRYGLPDGVCKSLEEVGKYFNVTRERIRQIEAKVLKKLRNPLRTEELRKYIEENN